MFIYRKSDILIDSKNILYSNGNNDECYTPAYGVKPIIKHIKKKYKEYNPTIWCPFDTEDSEFVKILSQEGFNVIASHISKGQDFYCYEPQEPWDCMISNPPFCFDDQTEVYTYDGWKTYDKIKETDKVLSVNPDTQELEWSDISSINIIPYNDTMLTFNTKTLNLCVTPYHRMYAHSFNGNKVKLLKDKTTNDLISANHITPNYHKQMRSGYKWKGVLQSCFTLPETVINKGNEIEIRHEKHIDMKIWVSFFGLWLADGYCRHTLNSNENQRYTVGIKQDSNGWEYVRNILNRLPFDFKEYDEKNTNKKNFEIHSQQLWEYLIQFGYSKDKFIPKEIKDLPCEYLQLLLDSYLFGDSYLLKNQSIGINTVSKQLSEDLQEIILKLGDVVNFHSRDVICRGKNYGKIYIGHWNKGKMTNSKYPKPQSSRYKGIVWCPELQKNGGMLCRRNETICFSGNTNKRLIFKRAMSFNKPFALMFSMTWLNDAAPKEIFLEEEKQMQILMFNKRIKFINNGTIQNKITFSTGYLCWNFLSKDIICERLNIE